MKRIDPLPDDVLLEIFDFYMIMNPSYEDKPTVGAWQSLVHVCQQWRNLVFGSTRRLNVQLCCTPLTPARDILEVWPTLPLIIEGEMSLQCTDNVIAVLGQSHRVRQVILSGFVDCQLEKVLPAMQVPFPELTDLELFSDGETQPVIPYSFLGGSAPRLQTFFLGGIQYPGLQNLLLSATRLVYLALFDVPHSISLEAMVTLLSVLSSLDALELEFQSPQSRPDWETQRSPPSKRSVVPALDFFCFKGLIEYLEDLVTFIDAPQLKNFYITSVNQIEVDTPRLAQFITCTPTLRALDGANVQFDDSTASVKLRYRTSDVYNLEIEILSTSESDRQLSSVARVCNSSLSPFSMVEVLYITHECSDLEWDRDVIENTLWLELLLAFTAVKDLYLSREFSPGIAAALQELVGARVTEVLPSLENIFAEGLDEWTENYNLQENIWQFAGARRYSGHPISISVWNRPDRPDREQDDDP